jgi:hypothetical protein
MMMTMMAMIVAVTMSHDHSMILLVWKMLVMMRQTTGADGLVAVEWMVMMAAVETMMMMMMEM